MWIRTQDKESLIKCSHMYITRMFGMDGTRVSAVCENGGNLLGEYSTEEKALKVMDMIETAILEYDLGVYIVFQMPEDSEVE